MEYRIGSKNDDRKFVLSVRPVTSSCVILCGVGVVSSQRTVQPERLRFDAPVLRATRPPSDAHEPVKARDPAALRLRAQNQA
eukprot:4806762-Prymnesium_polylepis.1